MREGLSGDASAERVLLVLGVSNIGKPRTRLTLDFGRSSAAVVGSYLIIVRQA